MARRLCNGSPMLDLAMARRLCSRSPMFTNKTTTASYTELYRPVVKELYANENAALAVRTFHNGNWAIMVNKKTKQTKRHL